MSANTGRKRLLLIRVKSLASLSFAFIALLVTSVSLAVDPVADPDGPRYNRHNSGDGGLPEFRNNLYTNAGHMWAFLAKIAHQKGTVPWSGD